MAGEFQGKVVVITGGSRGIGREIAVDFAKAGAQTVIVSSSDAQSRRGDQDHRARPAGRRRSRSPPTFASSKACQQVFDTVKDKFGRCDILVNSAGATKAGNFVDLPDEAWMDGYALKLFGCVRMCRAVLADAEGGATASSSTSAAARRARRAPTSPSAASVNAAMGNFSKGLSQLGKKRRRQRQRHPSRRDRDRAVRRTASSSARRRPARSVDELRKEATAKDGLRRLGKPEDISALTLFLCSEKARHIQGTAIAVDGGSTVGYY